MATQNRFVAKNGLDNNGLSIINVLDPVNNQDASTKAYSSNATNLASGTVSPARLGSGTPSATTLLLGNSSWSAATLATLTFLATPTSANLLATLTDETGSGALVFATSPTLVTPILGTPTSGTLTSCTGLPLTTGVTGTLLAINGGTGKATTVVGDLIQGGSTNTWTTLTAVSTGNALISGGAGVVSSWGKIGLTTHISGTLPVANGGTGVTASTGSGSNVLSTSPTLTTPLLGIPTSGTLTNCTGLPISTGVTGMATGSATFLNNPTSANFLALLSDKTGTGGNVFSTSPTLITPVLGAATGTSLTVTGALTSSGGGIGYATGSGGTVTQATSRTTGVGLSKLTGQITLFTASLTAGTSQSFVLTNTTIAATDCVVINHISGGTLGLYNFSATPAAGSATITIRNNSATASASETPVLQFVIVKAVTA